MYNNNEILILTPQDIVTPLKNVLTLQSLVTLATFEFAIAFPLNNQECIHCQGIQEKFNKRKLS